MSQIRFGHFFLRKVEVLKFVGKLIISVKPLKIGILKCTDYGILRKNTNLWSRMCTLQHFYEHNTGVYTFRMIFGDLEEKLKNWTSKFVLFDTFNSAREKNVLKKSSTYLFRGKKIIFKKWEGGELIFRESIHPWLYWCIWI